MEIKVQVPIHGTKEAVWRVITDIDNAAGQISGIDKVEILERPDSGLLGLKWRETRTLFGRTATEEMWISAVDEPNSYAAKAENQGVSYETTFQLSEQGDTTLLTATFGAQTTSLLARIMSATIGRLFLNATRKALLQDLHDIKAAVERA